MACQCHVLFLLQILKIIFSKISPYSAQSFQEYSSLCSVLYSPLHFVDLITQVKYSLYLEDLLQRAQKCSLSGASSKADTLLCAFGTNVQSRQIIWYVKEKKNRDVEHPLQLLYLFSFRILGSYFLVQTSIKLLKPREWGPNQEEDSVLKNKYPVTGFLLSGGLHRCAVLCLSVITLFLSLRRLYVKANLGMEATYSLCWILTPTLSDVPWGNPGLPLVDFNQAVQNFDHSLLISILHCQSLCQNYRFFGKRLCLPFLSCGSSLGLPGFP